MASVELRPPLFHPRAERLALFVLVESCSGYGEMGTGSLACTACHIGGQAGGLWKLEKSHRPRDL